MNLQNIANKLLNYKEDKRRHEEHIPDREAINTELKVIIEELLDEGECL